MHWLEKFRRKFKHPNGSCGITREELAAMVKLKYGKCSPVLIGIIESGGITHPNIADQIAAVAGATVKQRDSMVHESRRIVREPMKPKRRSEHKKQPPPMALDVIPDTAHRVVALDSQGNVVERFESLSAAARSAGTSAPVVYSRCVRKVQMLRGEFAFRGYTWRFAEEWDSMSDAEKAADMENARKTRKREGKKKCAQE